MIATSLYYKIEQHRRRYIKRVTETGDSMLCMECSGEGGCYDDAYNYGYNGPWSECHWCFGTGYVTRWDRGLWLRLKKEEKRNSKENTNE